MRAKRLFGTSPTPVGIPTKWAPRRDEGAYFSDEAWDIERARRAVDIAFERLENYCKSGGIVVIPKQGIGTGLAELPTRAPKLYQYICDRIRDLEAL